MGYSYLWIEVDNIDFTCLCIKKDLRTDVTVYQNMTKIPKKARACSYFGAGPLPKTDLMVTDVFPAKLKL